MSAPDGDEFQPTAICSARTLCSSSFAASSLLPIQPRTTASMAFVHAAPGLTAAPCSPHVGLSRVDSAISRAAARSALARSFMKPLGLSSAMRCASCISAFVQSAATSLQTLLKSAARVADVLSIAHRMSKSRLRIFDDSPAPTLGRWPKTNASSSRPSDDAPSMCRAKLPSEPPCSMMYSPTSSCASGPISVRMFSHVRAPGTHSTYFVSYLRRGRGES
jgi:hypothetical protein